jgi:hypothetical protein
LRLSWFLARLPLSAVPACSWLPRRLHRLHRNARNDVAERFDAARAHVRARVPKDVGAPERDAWLSEFCTATWAKSPRPRSNSIESDRGLES